MFHTSSSLARPSASAGIFSPFPLRMALKRSSSVLPEREAGSVQSSSFSCMLVASSVLPLPLSPWHTAQSTLYSFLARACPSGVTLWLLAGAAEGAWNAVTPWGRGGGGTAERRTAESNRIGFNKGASSVAGANLRHLAAGNVISPKL